MACGKYRHKSEELWHREGANIPKYHYCEKVGHVKKYCRNRIREEKSRNNKKKDNQHKLNDSKIKNDKEKIATRRKRPENNLQTTSHMK